MNEALASITFDNEIVHWRGPAPYLFVPVPEEHVGEVSYAARIASYGWGCVPVEADIEGVAFTSSLFPRDGGYMLPVKVAVQKAASVGLGDRVRVRMTIRSR